MNLRRHSLLTLLALLALVGSIVVAVPVATAQIAGLDQYQPNPANNPPSGASNGGASEHGGGAGADASGDGSSDTGTSAGAGGASGGDGGSAGSGSGGDRGGVVGVPTSAGPAEGNLGEIPFTDYPMTPLLLGVILLVVAGLIAKLATYFAARYRSTSQRA